MKLYSLALLAASSCVAVIACVSPQPATDTYDTATSPTTVTTATTPPTTTTPTPTDPTTPTTPTSPPPTVTVAYTQDLASIFQADCVRCHSGSRPDAGYSMTTYEGVMRAVVAGNARSPLVTTTQNRGSMYRYWSGTAATKAELVRKWVVENNAARSR
jgi:hypothetical protein